MPRGLTRCPYCGALIPNSYISAHSKVCLVRRAGQGDTLAAAKLEIKKSRGLEIVKRARGQASLEAFIGAARRRRSS